MPDGVMQWFDEATGEGQVLHAGHRYRVTTALTEPRARYAGARVHFDIERRDGVPTAVDVRARPGTRTSPRHRRFGDLVGARRPDTKGTAPFAVAEPDLGRDHQRHPLAVAQRWARALAEGDLDRAGRLCAPDVALHVAGDVVTGAARVTEAFAAAGLVGTDRSPVARGDGDGAVVTWEGLADGGAVEARLLVRHGEIVEQWLGEAFAGEVGAEAAPAVIHLSGDLDPADRAQALEKIGKVVDHVGRPVHFVAVRLTRAGDPARERPVTARATIDLDGQPVRAHVSAGSATEAIDLLQQRLEHRVQQLTAHGRALLRRRRDGPDGPWRHPDHPVPRSRWRDLPVDEREVVRHKALTDDEQTVDEAVFDLEALDYDFYLFTDLATGADALVHRRPGGGYGLVTTVGGEAYESVPAVADVTLDPQVAPTLDLPDARGLLEATDEPWLFHTDPETGRGRALYRRLDGHYGLVAVEPAA